MFVLHYVFSCFPLLCFELHLVSMLCYFHCIMFVRWICTHPYAIVLYWLHVQMIICFAIWSFIFIWLLCVWSSCLYVSHHVYLIAFLLVTLYLSFYNLLYLEHLMCFVQVFQVIGIYIPSLSQFLDLVVSEFCHCSGMFKKCV